ncbi:hypothetical protein H6F38_20010 [Paenibacillus sp. EKM208P]|nr:hypothetical protein H6F38_20010 [Paenibacillus sp. EKM208P]
MGILLPMNVTNQERELIEFIRILKFDDLLDATFGIDKEKDELARKSAISSSGGYTRISKEFKQQSENLGKLSDLLGYANEDYRFHIDPDDMEEEQ